MQTSSGSSFTSILPLASGPSPTSLPPTNQLVQLPIGLWPAVNIQKGRHVGGVHISSVVNTVQPPLQSTPQRQGRIRPRKVKLPLPMLLQLVHGRRDEPHTAPEKCTVVGPEILEISDYILD